MATKIKKYKNVYVSKLRPNSTDAERILLEKLSKGLSSKEIVAKVSKKLETSFKYDGKIGSYLIYKAKAIPSPFYYVLNIS